MDCRRAPTEDDIIMYNWIKYYNYDTVVIATKTDKLIKSELCKNLKLIRETLQLKPNDQLLTFSSLKKLGKQELLDVIEQTLTTS